MSWFLYFLWVSISSFYLIN